MTLPGQSYTYELVRERVAVFDAPLVCTTPDCDEAVPAPPPHVFAERDRRCPRCRGSMCTAPFARAVKR